MAESFDCETSTLLCGEDGNSCFDDLSSNGIDEFGLCPPTPQKNNRTNNIEPSLNRNRSQFLMDLPPLQSGELLIAMVEKESELLPTDDYLERLRSGDLDLSVRREALDWIWKANALCGFGPLCMCLATNYLDRFLSLYELPKGKSWAVQLSAVACLSLAAKMEETKFPFTVDLQVGDPKFFFESKTITRMELVVLSTLKWRMHAFTPCSFIDYFLSKMSDDQLPSMSSIHRSLQLILGTIRGIDFLEFKPSEIAAAVAISASGEVKAVDIDRAMACFLCVKKGKVLKCFALIKDLLLTNRCTNGVPSGSIPQSPVGVLDAACLSYKSYELTTAVGSCANSSSLSSPPNNKRRKIDDVGFKS